MSMPDCLYRMIELIGYYKTAQMIQARYDEGTEQEMKKATEAMELLREIHGEDLGHCPDWLQLR